MSKVPDQDGFFDEDGPRRPNLNIPKNSNLPLKKSSDQIGNLPNDRTIKTNKTSKFVTADSKSDKPYSTDQTNEHTNDFEHEDSSSSHTHVRRQTMSVEAQPVKNKNKFKMLSALAIILLIGAGITAYTILPVEKQTSDQVVQIPANIKDNKTVANNDMDKQAKNTIISTPDVPVTTPMLPKVATIKSNNSLSTDSSTANSFSPNLNSSNKSPENTPLKTDTSVSEVQNNTQTTVVPADDKITYCPILE